MSKTIFIFLLQLIGIQNIVSQNKPIFKSIKLEKCPNSRKTVKILKNVKAEIILFKKTYVIKSMQGSYIFVPCNLPQIKGDNIPIIFSGKIKEGLISVKSIGSDIELIKLKINQK